MRSILKVPSSWNRVFWNVNIKVVSSNRNIRERERDVQSAEYTFYRIYRDLSIIFLHLPFQQILSRHFFFCFHFHANNSEHSILHIQFCACTTVRILFCTFRLACLFLCILFWANLWPAQSCTHSVLQKRHEYNAFCKNSCISMLFINIYAQSVEHKQAWDLHSIHQRDLPMWFFHIKALCRSFWALLLTLLNILHCTLNWFKDSILRKQSYVYMHKIRICTNANLHMQLYSTVSC